MEKPRVIKSKNFCGEDTYREVTLTKLGSYRGGWGTILSMVVLIVAQAAMVILKTNAVFEYGVAPLLDTCLQAQGAPGSSAGNGTATWMYECRGTYVEPKMAVALRGFDKVHVALFLLAANQLNEAAVIHQLTTSGGSTLESVNLAGIGVFLRLLEVVAPKALMSLAWKPAQLYFVLTPLAYAIAMMPANDITNIGSAMSMEVQVTVLGLMALATLCHMTALVWMVRGRNRWMANRLDNLAGVAALLDWRGLGNNDFNCAGHMSGTMRSLPIKAGADINQPQHICICPADKCLGIDDDGLYGAFGRFEPERRSDVLKKIAERIEMPRGLHNILRAMTSPGLTGVGKAEGLDEVVLGLEVESGLWTGTGEVSRNHGFKAIILAAGTGKSTLCANAPEQFVDIDDIVPEHQDRPLYSQYQAWRLANLTAMLRVHEWCKDMIKIRKAGQMPYLLCHGPTQLPPYFTWIAAQLPQQVHEFHIMQRTGRHADVSRLNYSYVKTLNPIEITDNDLNEWAAVQCDVATINRAPYTLLPIKGLVDSLEPARPHSSETERANACQFVMDGENTMADWPATQAVYTRFRQHETIVAFINAEKHKEMMMVHSSDGVGYVPVSAAAFIAGDCDDDRDMLTQPNARAGSVVAAGAASTLKFANVKSIREAIGLSQSQIDRMISNKTLAEEVSMRLTRLGSYYLGIGYRMIASTAVIDMVRINQRRHDKHQKKKPIRHKPLNRRNNRITPHMVEMYSAGVAEFICLPRVDVSDATGSVPLKDMIPGKPSIEIGYCRPPFEGTSTYEIYDVSDDEYDPANYTQFM